MVFDWSVTSVTVLVACLSLATSGQQFNPCNNVLGQTFRPDHHSCEMYHFCTPTRDWTLNCEHNTVWNQHLQKCVQRGSANDTCFTNSNGLSIQLRNQLRIIASNNVLNVQRRLPTSPFMISTIEKGHHVVNCTANSTMKFAHPSRCAQYYDCASNPANDWWGTHLKECEYPELFNDRTKACDDFLYVSCGNRLEPKDPCDYVQHQCRSGNCVPCNIRFPTCSGMDNGLHEWRGRVKSPYFTQCMNERMTLTSRCQSSDPGNSMVFNEETRVCSMAA